MEKLGEDLLKLIRLKNEAKKNNAHPAIQKRIQKNIADKTAEIMENGLAEKIKKELSTYKGNSNA